MLTSGSPLLVTLKRNDFKSCSLPQFSPIGKPSGQAHETADQYAPVSLSTKLIYRMLNLRTEALIPKPLIMQFASRSWLIGGHPFF
jgi:hypothetical protein